VEMQYKFLAKRKPSSAIRRDYIISFLPLFRFMNVYMNTGIK